jgi:hypothetical protein
MVLGSVVATLESGSVLDSVDGISVSLLAGRTA